MRRLVLMLVAVLAIGLVVPVSAQAAEHSAEDATVTNPKDDTTIAITVFKPAGASSKSQVPVILHSHGWGGSRETAIGGDVEAFLDAGLGVVSIDQRGHGESTGEANIQDPTKETEDIKAVIDHVAKLDWVKHNKRGGRTVANDPVLGAIGASYGGGYQTMTTLDEIADEGRTRFDAIAPEITWFDLPESLAPQHVPRSAWDLVLYAAGASMLPQYVHVGNAWGASTGQWPDGTIYGEKVEGVPDLDSEFHKHSPVAFVEKGHRINIPMLLRQGTSDNLFNLNQGLQIFDRALSGAARSRSHFVSFNGGHALPNALPPGAPSDVQLGGGVDACSGDWTKLRITFFKTAFAGGNSGKILPARYNFTDLNSEDCTRTNSFKKSTTKVAALAGDSTVSTTGLGAPLFLEANEGPVSVTGVPTLAGRLSAVGLDSRAFFGLAVGTSPVDARVVQNNLMPLRQVMPVTDKKFKIELPGVAVNVPEGQSLFLVITPESDMYFGHSSKPPGGLVLSELELGLVHPKG